MILAAPLETLQVEVFIESADDRVVHPCFDYSSVSSPRCMPSTTELY